VSLESNIASDIVADLRESALSDPGTFLRPLAQALDHLAMLLNTQQEPSVVIYEIAAEAVAAYRQLAEDDPEVYAMGLANALVVQSGTQSGLGQRAAAAASATEAVAWCRRIPDQIAAQPTLAGSLSALVLVLQRVGDSGGALNAAKEYTGVLRQLANKETGQYVSLLGESFDRLVPLLLQAGDAAAALTATREALDTYQWLTARFPETYLPHLLVWKTKMAMRLYENSDHAGAKRLIADATQTYRHASATFAATHRIQLADTAENLTLFWLQIGDPDNPGYLARQCVHHRRVLVAEDSDRLWQLGVALAILAMAERRERNWNAAVDAAQESIVVFDALPRDGQFDRQRSLAAHELQQARQRVRNP